MLFGPGPQLAAQCVPPPPAPDGWRAWLSEVDGPIPEPLETRARALLADPATALGATESFPLPGVVTLIRVEPRVWGRDEQGALIQGCFKSAGVYLPELNANAGETVTPPTSPSSMSKLEKTIGVLTVASLVVGTVATLVTWGK